MSLLLHLSDLHLANTPSEDVVGDYKVEAVPEADRQNRVKLLRRALEALAKRFERSGGRYWTGS